MSTITFKGTRDGLVVTLGENSWTDTISELATQLQRPNAQSFFRGARVLLETGSRALDGLQLEELSALFAQYNMTLAAVAGEGSPPILLDAMRQAPPPPESIPLELAHATPPNPPLPTAPVLLVQRTVRSGQRVDFAGAVIVIGDVNPGAVVAASEDVIVWGKLRGVVHAGAPSNDEAMVGALILAPTQLRIGRYIARAADDKRPRNLPAEVARVREGRIVVEPWSGA